MHIIEIAALDNGAHRNQTYHGKIPPDWGETAFIHEDVKTLETFPFGDITYEEINGVPTVTSWTPLPMPEPEEPTEPEEKTTVWDELDAAYQEGYQEGVNNAYV